MNLVILIFVALVGSYVGAEKGGHHRSRRIVSGDESLSLDWQSTVFINFRQPKPRWKVCGGSLISKDWVITAASCIEDIPNSPTHITVGVGSKSLKYIPGNHNFTVASIVIHPNFVMPNQRKIGAGYSIDYDVALLQLSSPVPDTVKPVNLPNEDSDISTETDFECKAAGWGIKEPIANLHHFLMNKYDISKKLTEMNVKLMSKSYCIEKQNKGLAQLNLYGEDKDIPRLICGVSDNQDICTGDTGGPLICTGNQESALYGMILFGEMMCRPGKAPMYFLEVSKYLKWIKETAGV